MTGGKQVSVLGIRPVHPGRGEASYIELNLTLDYLKTRPVASVRLTPDQAIRLIEQAATAVRVTRAARPMTAEEGA